MTELTPRERFLRAAERKSVDRVCNEFIGSEMNSVSIVDQPPYGYEALCRYLNITNYAQPISDLIWGNVKNVDERILKIFGCDFRYVPTQPHSLEKLSNGYYRSAYGTLWKQGYGTSRHGTPRVMLAPDTEQPAIKLKTLKDIEEYPYWPDTESASAKIEMEKKAEEAAKTAKKLSEETEYAISISGCSPYSSEMHRYVRGFGRWFTDIKCNKEFYLAFADRMFQHGKDRTSILLNAVGDYIDRISAGPGDLGTQSGPMLSLADFKEFCLPYQEQSFKLIRKYTKAKICAHMCGTFHPYVESLAEIGLDIIGQQIGFAYKNEPERLKKDFGDIITFWGGIDTQMVLLRYTDNQIREWIKKCIETLSPGYITAANHIIERDISPRKILVALQAIKEFG